MSSKTQYTPLPPIEEGPEVQKERSYDGEHEYGHPFSRRWQRLLPLMFFLSGLAVGIAGVYAPSVLNQIVKSVSNTANAQVGFMGAKDMYEYYGLILPPSPTGNDPKCGDNRHDAKKNGCRYDLMATRWYSDECFHDDLLEQFLGEVNFTFYRDAEYTQVVPFETALLGDFDFLYPQYDLHIYHCLYQFRRLHRAVIEHRQIDDDVFSYAHTMHCTNLIMEWGEQLRFGKNTTTKISSEVSYCIPPFL